MNSSHLRVLGIGAAVCAFGASHAQSFTNGDFQTGNFSGWTITPTVNGQTASQAVVPYDIDGAGVLPTSSAAQFCVGQVVFQSGVPAGINLTQSLNLTGGVQYTFDFDWSAKREVNTNNAEGGIFSLIVNGNAITTQAAGATTGTTPIFGHITGVFTPGSTGSYSVGASITRPFTPGGSLFQYVDNFRTTAVPEPATMAALGLGVAALLRRRRKA